MRLTLLAAALALGAMPAAGQDLPRTAGHDVVILGEVHDNPHHHRRQAELLERMQPAAVAFEMLDPEQARIVMDGTLEGAALAEAIGWAESGWPEWPLYAPVFAALGEARVYGMALPRDEVRRAVSDGAAAAFRGDAARFGLDRPLPEGQQAVRERGQGTAHCDALPAELLPGMVEAQRLRDAHFAAVTLQALEETGGPVAVIAGTGHARTDWGMPAALSRAAPGLRVLSIGQAERGAPADAPYDVVLVSPPAERPDPCAGFSPT